MEAFHKKKMCPAWLHGLLQARDAFLEKLGVPGSVLNKGRAHSVCPRPSQQLRSRGRGPSRVSTGIVSSVPSSLEKPLLMLFSLILLDVFQNGTMRKNVEVWICKAYIVQQG
eukprot:Gb_18474 [translate_table: standard]